MMSSFSSASTNQAEIREIAEKYMGTFLGRMICPRQLWYEALEGCGVPSDETLETLTSVLRSLPDWEDIGNARYEKLGMQPSFKRIGKPAGLSTEPGKIMVQHLFEVGGLYKDPAGKVFKVMLAEVYNLRCFEVVDGHLTGPMVKIHPASDYAKTLVRA